MIMLRTSLILDSEQNEGSLGCTTMVIEFYIFFIFFFNNFLIEKLYLIVSCNVCTHFPKENVIKKVRWSSQFFDFSTLSTIAKGYAEKYRKNGLNGYVLAILKITISSRNIKSSQSTYFTIIFIYIYIFTLSHIF